MHTWITCASVHIYMNYFTIKNFNLHNLLTYYQHYGSVVCNNTLYHLCSLIHVYKGRTQHRNEYNISYILQNNKDLNNSDGLSSQLDAKIEGIEHKSNINRFYYNIYFRTVQRIAS